VPFLVKILCKMYLQNSTLVLVLTKFDQHFYTKGLFRVACDGNRFVRLKNAEAEKRTTE